MSWPLDKYENMGTIHNTVDYGYNMCELATKLEKLYISESF